LQADAEARDEVLDVVVESAEAADEAADEALVEPELDVDLDGEILDGLDGPMVDDGPFDLDLSDIESEVAPAGRGKRGVPAVRSHMPESLSAFNIYLAHVKTVAILPIEQQAELAVRFQETGDKAAAAALVASNLRLVVKIAFQFRRQWADVMDLIAEGNLGLAEAIRKFDATRGIPFPSYARFWIRARILAFIQENKHLIHAGSRAARKLFWRLERERRQLISEGLDPEPRRLADRLGVREEDVRELAPILDQRPVSLDVPVHGDEEGRTRGDVLADQSMASPEEWTAAEENQEGLRKIFAEFRETLDERERAIWDSRLMSDDGVRLEDLGDAFGVSKERVRQLEMRIKKRLKEFVQRRLGDDVIIEALG
jgi:RNA polymerase sigma-32 factor